MAAPASSDASSSICRPVAKSGGEASFPVESREAARSKEGLQLDLKTPVRPEQVEEEATPTPPESSSLSSDIETVTVATIEEESLSVLLEADRLTEPADESGTGFRSKFGVMGSRVQGLRLSVWCRSGPGPGAGRGLGGAAGVLGLSLFLHSQPGGVRHPATTRGLLSGPGGGIHHRG